MNSVQEWREREEPVPVIDRMCDPLRVTSSGPGGAPFHWASDGAVLFSWAVKNFTGQMPAKHNRKKIVLYHSLLRHARMKMEASYCQPDRTAMRTPPKNGNFDYVAGRILTWTLQIRKAEGETKKMLYKPQNRPGWHLRHYYSEHLICGERSNQCSLYVKACFILHI
ncbi:hypothetical protein E2C01_029213 [Portunus trituberculatus]|uniref:Uncharacterized protein n=1 Tax=Portunus trituberculatus TaxID=210409 RepID=A0A5B7ER73_PORTR|nr:hypothetical protein [Portunus trituberculatus]